MVGGELEDVADLRPGELLVELGDDGAAADHVAVVLGGEARLRLAVLRAGDVDGDLVALDGRRGRHRDELGVLLAEVVDAVVDVLVGDLGRLDRDPQAWRTRRR